MVQPPVYLSPLQTIVGVGWTTNEFAVLQWDVNWRHDDGLENPNNFKVSAAQLGVSFPIFSNVNIVRDDGVKMIGCKPPIRDVTSSTTGGSGMRTYNSYTWHMVGPGALISNGGWNIRVQTVGGETTAIFVGSPPLYEKLPPPYDQSFPSEAAAIAWQVERANAAGGVLTYTKTGEDGPYVVSGDTHTIIQEIDRAVILFALAAIRPKIGTDNKLTLSFDTGDGPGGGWDDLGNWYTWAAQTSTHKPAKWNSFDGDPPTWPVAESAALITSDVVQGSHDPTPTQHLVFDIDLTSLAVTT